MKQPNVLLVMTDQHRWDALGCYGNHEIETPNLDWLASEGTLFSHAYSATPSCVPARASLLTGMDPWNTGSLGGTSRMGGGFEYTMPGELAQAGYHTQGIGKMNFDPVRALNGFHHTVLMDSSGNSSDYVRWFNEHKTGDYGVEDHGVSSNSWMARPYHAPEFLHPVNWTVNEAVDFLGRRDPTRPFFLKVSFSRPHSPYAPPQYYFDMYNQKELSEPHVGEWAAMHDVPEDAANPNAWRGARSREETRRAKAGYYGLITQIDQQIGRLFDQLRKHKQWENTMVIFLADHGDMLGDHNLWRKTYGYEGSAHIPMLVRLPRKMQKGIAKKVDAPVCLQDVMPTVLDLAGVEVPDTVDGSSLLPLIHKEPVAWRDYVHGEHITAYSEEQEMQYLTDGKWKYIWFPRLGTDQLFNLKEDPYECMDLADNPEYADEKRKWKLRLISELEPRNLGLTSGEELVCQAGKPRIVSPKYKERVERASLSSE